MNVITKYNIGDKVFTIETSTLKVKEFVIDNMNVCISGTQRIVILYEKDCYTGYDENKCFPSEAELLSYITSKNS